MIQATAAAVTVSTPWFTSGYIIAFLLGVLAALLFFRKH